MYVSGMEMYQTFCVENTSNGVLGYAGWHCFVDWVSYASHLDFLAPVAGVHVLFIIFHVRN
jgi:hypothetical protein